MLIPIDNSNLECYFNLSQHYEADFSSLTGKRPNSKRFEYRSLFQHSRGIPNLNITVAESRCFRGH